MVAAAAERLEAFPQSDGGLDSLEPKDVIRHFTSAFRHHDTTKHNIFSTGWGTGFGMPAGLSALSGAWNKIADLLADVFELTALEEFGHLHAAELW